jgi:uncharacterized protein (TIGR03083 family)
MFAWRSPGGTRTVQGSDSDHGHVAIAAMERMKGTLMIRQAYEQAARLFVDTVARIQAPQWDQTALGEWTVRDLAGHTNRALITVETYLDKAATSIDMERPAEYFLRARAALADPAAVAARGREAGQALGADPAAAVRTTAERVLTRLQGTPDEAPVGTPVGGMRLIDYLPTRIFELTIHTLDLTTATSLDVRVPPTAATVTSALVTELAIASDRVAPLLLAATGRGGLPAGYTVL